MLSTGGKTVALIDPLWIGHHPMYFSQFAASFLRAGAHVIGLCPEPEAAMHDLRQTLGTAKLSKRALFFRLPAGKRSFLNGRFEGDPVRTFSRWQKAAEILADAEVVSGLHADMVYFPYLDSYLRFLPFPAIPRLLLNRPWSGLYLRNHHHGEPRSLLKSLRLLAKGDAILKSDQCLGIGVLDERFIPAMTRMNVTVTAYPDVTRADLPPQPHPLAQEIRDKAAGRKVIGIIGIERRKGFLTLLRTAVLAQRAKLPYYFACAGTFCLSQFTEEEQSEILSISAGITSGEIDNLHFDPSAKRIPDEADYNSVFRSFDIAWAAYEGFQGSSGTLSKAAAFEIPCLATRGECVGQRVETYRLGLTIPEGDAPAALAALGHLLLASAHEGNSLAPRFANYREDHSLERLDHILAELLERV